MISSIWSARLPQGWAVLPLKQLASIRNSNVDKKSYEDGAPVRLCNYVDVYKNEFITGDLPFMEATATDKERAAFTLRGGDVIITKDSEAWNDIGVPAYVPADLPDVVCGYHLTMLRPNSASVYGRFLFRALQASGIRDQLWVSANGVTRFGLTQRGIKDAHLPLPPLASQYAIAEFLDQKTKAIDGLIEKKERMLDLLQEKCRALITQAVTKGLDPTVSMKDSGVDWLGRIPSHWGMINVRMLVERIEQGWSPQCENRPAEPEEWGVTKVGCVNGGSFREDENKALPAGTEPKTEFEICSGDLLMSRANTRSLLGSTALVRNIRPKLLLSDKLYRLRYKRELVHPEYLEYALSSRPARFQLERSATGASDSMQNISQDSVLRLVLPLAPVSEQDRIVSTTRRSLDRISRLEKSVKSQIGMLREYRQAIITAAVTGQLDVAERIAEEGVA